MTTYRKRNPPAGEVRRFLEPGPIILVSSRSGGRNNIMTMGWHMILGEEPSLVGCFIWSEDHSRGMIRRSRECVINVPETHLAATAVDIGNTSGRDIDKFAAFGLTPEPIDGVDAPAIRECHASFGCRLVDTSLVRKYSLFVFEVVSGQAAVAPKYPRTLHYRGDGVFMLAGGNTSRWRRRFRADRL